MIYNPFAIGRFLLVGQGVMCCFGFYLTEEWGYAIGILLAIQAYIYESLRKQAYAALYAIYFENEEPHEDKDDVK